MGARREVVSAVTSVTGRQNSSTSCARRRAGIASMRCAHSGNADRWTGQGRGTKKAESRYGATIKNALTALRGCVGSGVRQAAQGDDPDVAGRPRAARPWPVRSSKPDDGRCRQGLVGAYLSLLTREGSLVVEAINRAQSLFHWLLRGVDFDNDSAFMNDVVVPRCSDQKLEVADSRAYKKNDQGLVEPKMEPSCAALWLWPLRRRRDGARDEPALCGARLYVNFFQPSVKLKEKRREGAKVIKRYHLPSTPYERALAHGEVIADVKKRLRDQYRSLGTGRSRRLPRIRPSWIPCSALNFLQRMLETDC
jgi:hypothetical protein